jgi:hypothetical protein
MRAQSGAAQCRLVAGYEEIDRGAVDARNARRVMSRVERGERSG